MKLVTILPPHFIPYVQSTKNAATKKWVTFELLCEVYLEYIVTQGTIRELHP